MPIFIQVTIDNVGYVFQVICLFQHIFRLICFPYAEAYIG